MPAKKYFTEEQKLLAKIRYREKDKLKKRLKYKLNKQFREKEKQRTKLYHKNNPHIAKISTERRKIKLLNDLEFAIHTKKIRKKWLFKNRKKIKLQRKEYIKNNRDKINLAQNLWKQKNREIVNQRARLYSKKPENRKKINDRFNKRIKTDVVFKIRRNLKLRLYKILKTHKWKKHFLTKELLGCDWNYFKIYFEKKFSKGMTWDNYGQWHIDHIIPISKFNLLDKNEQLKSCNYKNLQPLWSIDNIRKGNRIING